MITNGKEAGVRAFSLGGVFFLRAFFFLWAVFSLCGCGGYSREEKERVEAIREQGGENAAAYVEEKYGFTAEVEEVQVCMERGDGDLRPWANGYVLAVMRYGESRFRVHISGEEAAAEGRDDFQREMIVKEAREYFEDLLGYELYDIYLEYREDQGDEDPFPRCHRDGLISERYSPGGLEWLLANYSVSARLDDCGDRDLTGLAESRPEAAAFFEKYAGDHGFEAVLISYRSQEAYQKGCDHTYGAGGLLDFGIWKDGLYIRSYAAFCQEGERHCRFELQEYDGMIFSCADRDEGRDLTVSGGEKEWMDLGETRGEPVSKVYSVQRDKPGEITVYIPTERYGRSKAVFIQHFYKDRWWQYEDYTHLTQDKTYLIVTYHGISGGSFDFAVFEK